MLGGAIHTAQATDTFSARTSFTSLYKDLDVFVDKSFPLYGGSIVSVLYVSLMKSIVVTGNSF